ncbi:hypothetical protein C8R44DRAFT_736105 [Mycena epipterygia]|nr:hypothetical protein C8R44DRAFT_736105 [Mycena epipterygia]
MAWTRNALFRTYGNMPSVGNNSSQSNSQPETHIEGPKLPPLFVQPPVHHQKLWPQCIQDGWGNILETIFTIISKPLLHVLTRCLHVRDGQNVFIAIRTYFLAGKTDLTSVVAMEREKRMSEMLVTLGPSTCGSLRRTETGDEDESDDNKLSRSDEGREKGPLTMRDEISYMFWKWNTINELEASTAKVSEQSIILRNDPQLPRKTGKSPKLVQTQQRLKRKQVDARKNNYRHTVSHTVPLLIEPLPGFFGISPIEINTNLAGWQSGVVSAKPSPWLTIKGIKQIVPSSLSSGITNVLPILGFMWVDLVQPHSYDGELSGRPQRQYFLYDPSSRAVHVYLVRYAGSRRDAANIGTAGNEFRGYYGECYIRDERERTLVGDSTKQAAIYIPSPACNSCSFLDTLPYASQSACRISGSDAEIGWVLDDDIVVRTPKRSRCGGSDA